MPALNFKGKSTYATNEFVSVGDMKVISEKEQKMIFRILMEKTWTEDLNKLMTKK